MGINTTSPTTFTTAVLIGDTQQTAGGSNDSIPTLTEANNLPVSAALEIQSTNGGLLLPRMTTAQINALPNPTNGMLAYNSSINSAVSYQNGSWNAGAPSSITTTVTSAQIGTALAASGMYATPVQVVPAPGAGFIIIVDSFFVNYVYSTAAYTAGGVITLQYGNAGSGAGTPITGSLSAATIIANVNRVGYGLGLSVVNTTAALTNTAVYITNATGNFSNPGTAAGVLNVTVYYTIVPAV